MAGQAAKHLEEGVQGIVIMQQSGSPGEQAVGNQVQLGPGVQGRWGGSWVKSCGCNFVTVFLKRKHRPGFLTVSVMGNSGFKHPFMLPRLRGTVWESYPKLKATLQMLKNPFPFLWERTGEKDLIREISNSCNVPKPCHITQTQGWRKTLKNITVKQNEWE